jgi:hypothetical protein
MTAVFRKRRETKGDMTTEKAVTNMGLPRNETMGKLQSRLK